MIEIRFILFYLIDISFLENVISSILCILNSDNMAFILEPTFLIVGRTFPCFRPRQVLYTLESSIICFFTFCLTSLIKMFLGCT